ncbi:MAG: F0F1 ATP synthase subunit delta [Oscillospiraceae bacterium]|nr:F0F1 ATP synthase subunit delta [Ruminococcus sp.]MDE6706547.1 F0F1 ATP synthase subunit delta [Oscillospiraceae bacterium]
MTQTVGKVYAEALFQLAKEEQKEKQVYTELKQFADIIKQYPDFVVLLDVPTLSIEERIAILKKVIGNESGITENFLCLLVEKHRFYKILEICEAFNHLYYEHCNAIEVFVTTAVKLQGKQKIMLMDKLIKKFNKLILMREIVDKSLIGGMIIQYGDTKIDNSIRNRMQQFKDIKK